MDKRQLRNYAKQVRATITTDQRAQCNARLATFLFDVIENRNPEIIGLYYPVGTEISPLGLLSPDCSLRKDRNKKIALPVARHDEILEYYEWREGAPLVTRDFNIPIPDTRGLSPIIPDMIIAPLLLCDRHGNRLGQGKGHYDRYMTSLTIKPFYIGVCFEEQVYDKPLPAETHDVRLDMIVTPDRVIKVK